MNRIINIEWQYLKPIRIFRINISCNNLTVCKQINFGSFKNNITYKLFVYKPCVYVWTGFGFK